MLVTFWYVLWINQIFLPEMLGDLIDYTGDLWWWILYRTCSFMVRYLVLFMYWPPVHPLSLILFFLGVCLRLHLHKTGSEPVYPLVHPLSCFSVCLWLHLNKTGSQPVYPIYPCSWLLFTRGICFSWPWINWEFVQLIPCGWGRCFPWGRCLPPTLVKRGIPPRWHDLFLGLLLLWCAVQGEFCCFGMPLAQRCIDRMSSLGKVVLF